MPPREALQRLKNARLASQQLQMSSQHAASRSDVENEAYMHNLHEAFDRLTTRPTCSGQLQPAPRHDDQAISGRDSPKTGSRDSSSGSSSSGTTKIRSHNQASAGAPAVWSSAMQATSSKPGGRCVDGARIASGWRTGPVDNTGLMVQVSERPLMCGATLCNGSRDIVVGSSDHALYVVDPAAGQKKRTLFSKTTGHTDLPGGRVLSGGMDGRLWLWPAGGASGTEIQAAHTAPVSQVAALLPHPDAGSAGTLVPEAKSAQTSSIKTSVGCSSRSKSSNFRGGRGARVAGGTAASSGGPVLAVSCSYDKTVKVWDVSGPRGKQVAVMTGHTGPVLELAVCPGRGGCLLTGDRKGSIICWDVDTASSSWGVKDAHQGHVTSVAWLQQQQQQHGLSDDSISCASDASSCCTALSGGQDGGLRVWDGRSGSCVVQQPLHVGLRGKGAIGGIATVWSSSRQLVVTAAADQTLKVLDPAASFRPLHTLKLTDFPYSVAAVGDGLLVCGCGDGSVHVVDAGTGETLYALGAGRAAVRVLQVQPSRLVCAGDDGCVACYQFM